MLNYAQHSISYSGGDSVKIIIEPPGAGEEEQIIVKCHSIPPELLHLLNAFKARDNILVGYVGSEIHRVAPKDIFYIDTVDNKTFLYCEKDIYESKQKLYELEKILTNGDFLRISKSVIVNLSKIKSLSPALSGRLEAVLHNNESVIISRQYVGELKKIFGI